MRTEMPHEMSGVHFALIQRLEMGHQCAPPQSRPALR